MKPLQSVGMGLVVVALTARVGGYDALPDPLGWLLVLAGVRRLPDRDPARGGLTLLVWVALAVSAVLWVPATGTWLDAHDESLRWAVNLPQAITLAWLAHVLARLAAPADPRAARWLRTDATLLAATAVAPVLVFGGGLEALEVPAYVLAGVALLLLVTLCFVYAARPWTQHDPPPPEG